VLSFSCSFLRFCYFLCLLLALRFFLLLDDLLEFFLDFWSSSCAPLGLGFEIQTLCFCVVNELIKGEIERPHDQYLGLICHESLTCQGLNLNSGHFGCFYLYLCSCGESCLLVSWCAGGRCGMKDNDEDHSMSRRFGAEDRRWSHMLDTRVAG
jgi:hypothetical protein